MDTAQSDQRTITVFSQDTYLLSWIKGFLLDRKAQYMSKGTLTFYQNKLKLFIDYCNSQVITQITELTPEIIRLYLLYLEEKGHNPGGVHAAFRTLWAFLYWSENEVELESWKNPIRKVKAPKLAQEPLEPISKNDFESLITTCDQGWHGTRDRAILLVLLDSGLRASELTALNLADLDAASGELEVRQVKGRKPRVTFIGSLTRRALRQWLKHRGGETAALFLTKDGERLTYSGLR